MSINMLSHGVSPSWIAAPMSVDSSYGEHRQHDLPQGEVGSGLGAIRRAVGVPLSTMRFDPAEPLSEQGFVPEDVRSLEPQLGHRTATSRLASSIKARMAVRQRRRLAVAASQQGGDAETSRSVGLEVPLLVPLRCVGDLVNRCANDSLVGDEAIWNASSSVSRARSWS